MANIRPYISECVEIDKICKKYGYGNVMEWASALWRRDMRSKDCQEKGCFVPTCPSFIKPEYQNPKQHELYDSLVARIFGGEREDG
jgi:hypothetical protein|nr:MAG TPA: hypothetical protein [Caudoviricetes sp.]